MICEKCFEELKLQVFKNNSEEEEIELCQSYAETNRNLITEQLKLISDLEDAITSFLRKIDYNGQDFAIYCRMIESCWGLKASLDDWECHIDDD